MITITNNQPAIRVNELQLKADAEQILSLFGYEDFDLGILLTTDDIIQNYNRTYRSKDKATDILSFPYHTDLQPGQHITPQTPDDKNIGDIIIALQYVHKDAPNWGHTFEQRMRVLLVHGICHLLGYDHITDEDYAIMKEKEEWLHNKLGIFV